MNKLCLFLLFLPCALFAQIDFNDIDGKWQEEKRMEKKKTLDFNDTLQLEIRDDGFMMIRHTIGGTFIGNAEIKKKKLIAERQEFTIEEYKKNKLVLKDYNGTHYFKKVDEFLSSPIARKIPGKEEGEKNIGLNTLKGKWTCYKKTDPNFDRTKFYLKSILFTDDKGNGTYMAQVAFNNMDSIYTTDAFVYVKGTDFIISSDDETFKAKVLKSDGEELILENGTINYFLKMFGKKE